MQRRNDKRLPLYDSPTYRALLSRVGANLRRLRETKEWTQEQAAEACGMAVPYFRRIEAGGTNVTTLTLARLCDGFTVDAVEFYAPAAPAAKKKPQRPKAKE